MFNRPSVYPEWAEDDVLDPITGQYNVAEPPPEKKLEGYAAGEKPPRQWLNWSLRTVSDWIKYLDVNAGNVGQSFVPTWTGITPVTVNQGYYSRQGDICFINVNVIWNAQDGNPLTMTNLPFLPKNSITFGQNLAVFKDGINTIYDGAILTPTPTILKGTVAPSSNVIIIETENCTTGQNLPYIPNPGDPAGRSISIQGFYFIEQ